MHIGYMCDTNIVAKPYYHGGKPVTTTTNIDRMTRTAREMTEAQRDSYEALANNLAASQKRTIGLANDGLKFFTLQQSNVRATQEWFANGVRLLQLQQRNAEFLQGWASDAVDAVREQTEHNVRTVEAFARGVSKQQEGLQALAQEWTGAYRDFFSPFAYAQQGLRTVQRATQQGLEATQQAAEQGLQATQQVARQGLRVAEEATEQTEEVLRQTEEATREVELRTSVLAALETDNYDGLTVAEITEKLDDLSADELKMVREFEKRNKDRESLVERIDRKIRALRKGPTQLGIEGFGFFGTRPYFMSAHSHSQVLGHAGQAPAGAL
jgi:predicted urease superfamily metal-dependent hydrolase